MGYWNSIIGGKNIPVSRCLTPSPLECFGISVQNENQINLGFLTPILTSKTSLEALQTSLNESSARQRCSHSNQNLLCNFSHWGILPLELGDGHSWRPSPEGVKKAFLEDLQPKNEDFWSSSSPDVLDNCWMRKTSSKPHLLLALWRSQWKTEIPSFPKGFSTSKIITEEKFKMV